MLRPACPYREIPDIGARLIAVSVGRTSACQCLSDKVQVHRLRLCVFARVTLWVEPNSRRGPTKHTKRHESSGPPAARARVRAERSPANHANRREWRPGHHRFSSVSCVSWATSNRDPPSRLSRRKTKGGGARFSSAASACLLFKRFGIPALGAFLSAAPLPHFGCCCVRQCSVPKPSTRSTAWMPTTGRSGNNPARMPSATRSLGSLKVGTMTVAFPI
jgi:hypothetical protein